MTKIPFSTLDTFHSQLMEDEQFLDAMMSVALKVAEDNTPGDTDEDDIYDIALELVNRVSVS